MIYWDSEYCCIFIVWKSFYILFPFSQIVLLNHCGEKRQRSKWSRVEEAPLWEGFIWMKYEKKEKLTSGVTSTLSGTKHIHSERVREKFTYIKKKKIIIIWKKIGFYKISKKTWAETGEGKLNQDPVWDWNIKRLKIFYNEMCFFCVLCLPIVWALDLHKLILRDIFLLTDLDRYRLRIHI